MWAPTDRGDELVGGLYGVAIGGLLRGRVDVPSRAPTRRRSRSSRPSSGCEREAALLFDVQWRTGHLASLGVVELARSEYLERVAEVVERPQLTLSGAGLDRSSP